MEEFANRVLRIDEKNVCAHISEVYLDFNNVRDRNGRPIIAIMGKVKPAGPHGPALEESFNNPREEVCFSIRAFTVDEKIAGIKQRNISEVVTFDHVTEPGIAQARKYYAPALESLCESNFTREAMVSAVKPIPGLALESNVMTPHHLFKVMGWDSTFLEEPKYLKW
jgi:hypothetical protein